MNRPLHNLIELPDVLTIGEFLPAFADVKHEVVIGRPNDECAGCGKPFTTVRKRRGKIRLRSTDAVVPIIHQFYLCGRCIHLCKSGGDAKQGVLAAVVAFFQGGAADD